MLKEKIPRRNDVALGIFSYLWLRIINNIKTKMMKKIINPWLDHPEYNCFGCCPDNPIGLHLEFYEDGDYIVSTWHPGHNYQGWIDTMHGGILSTLIDEVCGWVVTRKLQTSGYTVQLNVKFRKASDNNGRL